MIALPLPVTAAKFCDSDRWEACLRELLRKFNDVLQHTVENGSQPLDLAVSIRDREALVGELERQLLNFVGNLLKSEAIQLEFVRFIRCVMKLGPDVSNIVLETLDELQLDMEPSVALSDWLADVVTQVRTGTGMSRWLSSSLRVFYDCFRGLLRREGLPFEIIRPLFAIVSEIVKPNAERSGFAQDVRVWLNAIPEIFLFGNVVMGQAELQEVKIFITNFVKISEKRYDFSLLITSVKRMAADEATKIELLAFWLRKLDMVMLPVVWQCFDDVERLVEANPDNRQLTALFDNMILIIGRD
jgi:hypothetical protein